MLSAYCTQSYMVHQTFHAWGTTTTKDRGGCGRLRDIGRLPGPHSRSCPSNLSLPPRTKELPCLALQTTALMTGWGAPGLEGAPSTFFSLLCRGETATAGGTTAEGLGSHHRTFAHAVPAAEQNAFPSVCPARPCFLLTHIPTQPPSVPRSQPPCNFLRYPIIYSFILFMSALPPFS